MRYNRYWNKNGCIVGTDYTWRLASFAQDLTYEKIPQEAVVMAKKLLLSTVGAALAAKDIPIAKRVERLALEGNGGEGGNTTAWGTGRKLSALNSVLIAGTKAHLLDLEDNSWTGHPSAAVIPAAIIAAEERGKGGKELITAIVAAYEVYTRIAMAVQPNAEAWRRKGWGQNSWQIFAAAIAAGKLYDFDARHFDQTIGVCAESSPLACGFAQKTGSDFYYYEFGFRVRDGLLAVKAVDRGIWNARDTLDEQACYYGVICDTPDTSWFTKGLGSKYLICETKLKAVPGSLFLQGAVTATKAIVDRHTLTTDRIRAITVSPVAEEQRAGEVWNLYTKQQSAAYTIAANLIAEGDIWSADEEAVKALAAKVRASTVNTDLPTLYEAFRNDSLPEIKVSVETVDGAQYTAQVPMIVEPSLEELQAQFMRLAVPAVGETRAAEICGKLVNIEGIADVSEFAELL